MACCVEGILDWEETARQLSDNLSSMLRIAVHACLFDALLRTQTSCCCSHKCNMCTLATK